MAEYGNVYDVNDIKRQLVEANRDYTNKLTWQNMMQSTNLGAASAQSTLQQSYSSASSQAYSSYLKGQTALKNIGAVGSGVKSLEQQNEEYLQNAYNTYMSNLQSGMSGIEEQRVGIHEGIQEMLGTQATNIKEYAESMPEYLSYLYYTNPEMFDSKQWSKYTTGANEQFLGEGNNLNEQERARLAELEGLMKLDKEGNVRRIGSNKDEENVIRFKGNNRKLDEEYRALIAKRDAAGSIAEGTRRLMTRDELFAARQNEAGEEIGLYDSKGNLTLKGVDFFDQLMNSPELLDKSFGKFLAQTDVEWLMEQNEGMTRTEAKKKAERNAELYEWSQSYNPFNYTENELGESTMKGSFKEMIGMSSEDIEYSFIERFGGYTKTEIDKMYSGFNDLTNKIGSMNLEKDAKDAIKDIQGATTQLFDLMRDFGIDKEMREAGFDEEKINFLLQEALSATKSGKQLNGEWWAKTMTGVATGVAAGTISGGKVGAVANLIPGAGQIANLVTAIIGGIIGGIGVGVPAGKLASEDKKRQQAINKSNAEASKKVYLDLLAEIVNYSQQKRRQAEIDFYFNRK